MDHAGIIDNPELGLVRDLEQLFGLQDASCQVSHLIHVVLHLELGTLCLVQIRFSSFSVVADSRSQPIVEIVLEGVDPASLVLLERLSIRLDHLD